MIKEYAARNFFLFHVDPFSELKIKTSPEDEQAAENCVAAEGNNGARAEFHQGLSKSVAEDVHKEMI